MTYRQDSDIPYLHGWIQPRDGATKLPQPEQRTQEWIPQTQVILHVRNLLYISYYIKIISLLRMKQRALTTLKSFYYGWLRTVGQGIENSTK